MERWGGRSSGEELAKHGEWLRALARALIGDATEAEDLAQDALVVLGRRDVPSEDARPFLGTVLRRLASQWRRTRARVAAREREAARDERVQSSHELLERLELQEVLVRTLRGLPEPYRDALTLRFFDGLEPEEIARRTGVPAGTVRARLSRGLDELRARLDQRSGDRKTWMLALLPFARPRHVAVGASALGGVGIVTSKWVLISAVIVLALVSAPFVIARFGASAGAGSTPAARVEHVAPSADIARMSAEPSRDDEGREPAPSSSAAMSAESSSEDVARLVGRVVDLDGRAVAAARITCAAIPGASATADEDGRFELRLQPTLETSNVSLSVRAASLVDRIVAAEARLGRTTWLGDLELEPGGAIEGVVADSAGAPIAGAQVLAERYRRQALEAGRPDWMLTESAPRTRTDLEGRFRFDGLAVGSWTVWACAVDRSWAHTDGVFVTTGAAGSARLELAGADPARGIAGRVLDPDGAPLAGARVSPRGEQGHVRATTDELGEFSLELAPSSEPLALVVEDLQHRWQAIERAGIRTGERGVELRFERAEHVLVRVTNELEAPVERANVVLREVANSSMASALTDANGVAILPSPRTDFVLEARAGGFEPVRSELAADCKEVALRFASRAALRGRVSSAGAPVARAKLQLFRAVAGGSVRVPRTWRFECPRFADRIYADSKSHAISDEHGDFALPIPPLGGPGRERWYLVASAEGLATCSVGPIAIDAEGAQPLEVELVPGGAIEGVLHSTAGDPSGCFAWAHNGLGADVYATVGPDGRFRLDHLAPGAWQVRAFPPSGFAALRATDGARTVPTKTVVEANSRPPIAWDVRIAEGESVRFDLEMRSPSKVELDGRLIVAADPPGAWKCTIEAGVRSPRTVERLERWLAADGSFRLRLAGSGARTLHLSCEDPRWRRIEISDRLRGGDADAWSYRISFARLSGTSATRRSTILSCQRDEPAPRSCSSIVTLSDDGRFEDAWVPSGRVRIVDRTSREPVVLLELDLAEGEQRTIELP